MDKNDFPDTCPIIFFSCPNDLNHILDSRILQICYLTPFTSQTQQLQRQCRRQLTLYHEIRYCVMFQSSHAAESSSRISPSPPSTPPHYRHYRLTFGGKPRWRIYDSDCTSQPRFWLLVVQRFDQTLSYLLHTF